MIENVRALHAEIDRDISNIVIELQHKEKRQKRIVYQNHRINDFLLSVQDKSSKLLQLYSDPHHTIRNEIKELTGPNLQETMRRFDRKYLDLLRYHQSGGGSANQDVGRGGQRVQSLIPEKEEQRRMKEPFAYRMNKQRTIPFSVEEHYGRFLDLHYFYQKYMNLFPSARMKVPKVDYFTYLKIFPLFHRIDFRIRKLEVYLDYVRELYEYLVKFHKRTQPLANISHVMKNTETFFEEKWPKGELPGWEKKKDNSGEIVIPKPPSSNVSMMPPPPPRPPSNVSMMPPHPPSNVSLMPPPPPRPPSNVSMMPPHPPRTTNIPGQNPGKKRKRRKKRKRKRKRRNFGNEKPNQLDDKNLEKYRNTAYLETKISRFLNLLSDHLEATRNEISKKSVRTYSEYQMELDREEEKENEIPEEFLPHKNRSEEDEYAAMVANPLNLPIGWDGKPIPYWLFKLYNLGKEFKCEICGNYSYWGQRAFDRHFKEWRHAHGMKCLGVPNTKHFHHVTKIKEALKLWESMKSRQNNRTWEEDLEEFEDKQGNVYSRKTYEELKAQGILGD